MSAIKEIIDLVQNLASRMKDRQDMEIIHKIMGLASSVQSAQFEIQEKYLKVLEDNFDLKQQLSKMIAQQEQANAEDFHTDAGLEFRRGKSTGNTWKAFCPICHVICRQVGGHYICSNSKCPMYPIKIDDANAVIKTL